MWWLFRCANWSRTIRCQMLAPNKHPNEWKYQLLHHHTILVMAVNPNFPMSVCSECVDQLPQHIAQDKSTIQTINKDTEIDLSPSRSSRRIWNQMSNSKQKLFNTILNNPEEWTINIMYEFEVQLNFMNRKTKTISTEWANYLYTCIFCWNHCTSKISRMNAKWTPK